MSLQDILGEVDALKFRSFMTLLWFYYLNAKSPSINRCQHVTTIVRHSPDVYGRCPHTIKIIGGVE